MIKALFFDIDGTLLTSDQKIAKSTKTALKACKAAGIKVYIATGRSPLLKKIPYLKPEEWESLFDGGVFYNGACILYGENKKYHTIPDRAVKPIIDLIHQFPDLNLAVQMVDEKHSFRYPAGWTDIDSSYILDFKYPWKYDIVKFVVFNENIISDKIYKTLQGEVGEFVNIYHVYGGRVIDIININTSKKLAIDHIVNVYGYKADEIAVFGDDNNDMEMLKSYEYSIAMGNSSDAVKKTASYTTLTNDNNGIYHALKNYLKVI